VAPLTSYLLDRTAGLAPAMHEALAGASRGETPVGLLLSERLINMPAEIAPPMYSCLVDELEAAIEDGEPYDFPYYLLLSKVYREVESTLNDGERKPKKARDDSLFYFHPEDEILARHAVASGSFKYAKEDEANADSRRAFQEAGVKCEGFVVLIEGKRFGEAIAAVGDYLKAGGQ
jgi:protein BCP1